MHRGRASRALAAVAVAAASLSGAPAGAQDTVEASLADAVTKGTFSLGLRYRFESVDQAAFADQGLASTLRTTLGYRTGWWRGLAGFVQVEDVHDLGLGSEHNNLGAGGLANGVTDRPVIADPEITELNEVYLDWRPSDGFALRGGMQEITLGNHRFVGNVGWRQNHQSFEGARLDVTAITGTTLTYAFVSRVHRITGGAEPTRSHLAEAEHLFDRIGVLRIYGYLLDYQDAGSAGLSTISYGASLAGAPKLAGTLTLPYRIELAEQRDAADNPNRVSANYRRADLGIGVGRFTVSAGYELLGGEPGEGAFQTPLATLHAFNGWADVFLSTPANGLEDLFLSAAATFGRFGLEGIYHEFAADSGGADWGDELDLVAVYTAPWKQKIGVKAAFYDADAWATDTDKVWVWTEWGF